MPMKKISLLSITLAAMLGVAGCGLVDTPVEPSSESTITPYYFHLTEGHKYTYMVDDKKFSDEPYLLSMEMDGLTSSTYDSKPIYQCDWESSAFSGTGSYYHGYYAMNERGAYYMGGDSAGTTPKWLDLVAPVEQGMKWKFPYGLDSNEISAEIVKTGFKAALPDSLGNMVTFDDIIEVVYQGAEDKTVKWFCRNHAMLAEWKYNSKGEIIHKKHLWSYEGP
jgi:hypothetical protein